MEQLIEFIADLASGINTKTGVLILLVVIALVFGFIYFQNGC